MNTRANDGRAQGRHAVVLGGSLAAAALGAMTLQQCLREQNMSGLSRRFQKRLAKVIAAPWMLAIGEDYRYPETEGGSPSLMTRFMHRYMDRVVQLATHSVAVRTVLLRAFNMLVPPTALFQPRVLFRVLLQFFKSKRSCDEDSNRNDIRSGSVAGNQPAQQERLVC